MADRRRRRPTAALAFALVAAAALAPLVHAQSDDEEREARDRRYIERMRALRERPDQAPATAPADVRAEVVERFLARADDLIRDKNYRAASTDAYRILTDDPRLDADETARLLTGFRAWFDAYWDDRIDLVPFDEPSRMYLFWSYYKYNQLFTGRERFDEFRTTGHYRGFLDTVVVHTDGTPPDDLPDVLIHEAAHQLVHRRLLGDGTTGPPWLEEGLAEYFARTAQQDDGTFVEGAIGGKAVWPFRDGKPGRPAGARSRRDAAVRRDKTDADWSVETLIAAEPASFYSGDVQANYGAAWLLVHYLFHGEDGAHAAAFVDWIRRDVRGDGERALFDALGIAPDALDDRFASWARKLRVR